MKKTLTTFLWNSWTKTFFFIVLCVGGTYVTISYFSQELLTLVDLRKKETWIALSVLIPTIWLLPNMMNTFLFLKIVQIADNTKKTSILLENCMKRLEALEQKNTK